jgi:hypothetical protein
MNQDRLEAVARDHWISKQQFHERIITELFEARFTLDIGYLEKTHILEKYNSQTR